MYRKPQKAESPCCGCPCLRIEAVSTVAVRVQAYCKKVVLLGVLWTMVDTGQPTYCSTPYERQPVLHDCG